MVLDELDGDRPLVVRELAWVDDLEGDRPLRPGLGPIALGAARNRRSEASETRRRGREKRVQPEYSTQRAREKAKSVGDTTRTTRTGAGVRERKEDEEPAEEDAAAPKAGLRRRDAMLVC